MPWQDNRVLNTGLTSVYRQPLPYTRRVAWKRRNSNENLPLIGACDTPCLHIQTFRRIVYEVRKERINENGAMAQLVAHLHGMERVRGSNPLSSTDYE